MKTSLKKLRGALHKHDRNDTNKILPLAQLDELSKASADMEDMRDCYDSLLSAAAAAANSAYEFSESLHEMGACLLQKVALNDDEESGKVLMMLGKVQFELQKLVDRYRAHIFQTISIPSESLLNELHTVEEMKHQCDEKRELYDYMRTNLKEKERSKGGKGETFSSQQLQVARDEFDQEATLFVFRLKSLKQGQSRSLLTQAARHHAAQLCFFRKSLKSLEALEPHVKSVTQQQHIEYHFTGLDDDESEDAADDEDGDEVDVDNDNGSSNMVDDGELCFDYLHNRHLHKFTSASRKSMQVDLDINFPHSVKVDSVKETTDFGYDSIRKQKLLSQSAPLLPQGKLDPAARMRQLRPSSTKKFHSYVLPTPGDTKNSYATGNENPAPEKKTSPAHPQHLWHSVPLEPNKHDKLVETENTSGPMGLNSESVLKESNNNRTPPFLTERISSSDLNTGTLSHSKKIKRLSYSGPITSKPWTARHSFYRMEMEQFSSGSILKNPLTHSSSPKLSPSASPTLLSYSPRINELHELPRPPPFVGYQPVSPSHLIGYSAPLMSKTSDNSVLNKFLAPRVASPLPTPPVPGHSIPENSPRFRTVSPPSTSDEAHDGSAKCDDTISPPLTPISLEKENSQ